MTKDFLQIIKTRKSVREYSDKKIDKDILAELIDCARWAPSACNLQLTEYIFLDDKEKIKKLSQYSTGKFNWSPCFLILIYDSRFSREKNSSVISLGANMENILLACHFLGLASCPLTGFVGDKKIKEILEIPDFYEIGLIISLGYPKKSLNFDKERIRLPREEVLHINQYRQNNPIKESLNAKNWSLKDLINYRQRLAPVYFYRDHFKLNVFSEKIFKDIFLLVDKYIEKNFKVLDTFSYDCLFARELSQKREGDMDLTICDIFKYPLNVFTGIFPKVKSLILQDNFEMKEDNFNIITCIHKLEFNYFPDLFFKKTNQALKKDGLLFLTFSYEGGVKKIFKKIFFLFKKYILRKKVNVYENNPFYKIGPRKEIKKNKIIKLAKKYNFEIVEVGKRFFISDSFFKHKYFLFVLKKKYE